MITITKKYYEIYKTLPSIQIGNNLYTRQDGEIIDFLTVVETKEVAEDFCKRHKNYVYKEYVIQVPAITTCSGVSEWVLNNDK